MENGATTVEKNMGVPQKKKFVLWSSDSTFGYMPKRTESRVLKRYLYSHIYSSIIHNSQKVEAAQVSIDEWINKM